MARSVNSRVVVRITNRTATRDLPSLRAYMHRRARTAVRAYRTEKLKYDDPDYPFDRKEEERSIRDPSATTITDIPGGVRIEVVAPGAPYIERGNGPEGSYIEPKNSKYLALPLREKAYDSMMHQNEINRKRKSGPTFRLTVHNGRLLLLAKKVKAYEGTHRLRNAVYGAFGLRIPR